MLFLLTKINNLKRRLYYVNCAAKKGNDKKTLCGGAILGNIGDYPCSKCPYLRYNKYKKEENKDEN